MSFFEILLMGIGLAMDAFAVSVGKGLEMKKVRWKKAITLAVFFGGFQALMPVLGWFLGSSFAKFVQKIDHWLAFFLLGYIGVKMLIDAWKDYKNPPAVEEMQQREMTIDIKEIFILAIATSIDALAVGVALAFMKVSIVEAAAVIGIVTFAISLVGVILGHVFGSKTGVLATFAGGIILIGLGFKILLTDLMGL
jgi:putative Mn2+ efflux pump MntP